MAKNVGEGLIRPRKMCSLNYVKDTCTDYVGRDIALWQLSPSNLVCLFMHTTALNYWNVAGDVRGRGSNL